MSCRQAALVLVALSQVSLATGVAYAQRQKFKIGGGAGFAFLAHPDIELGSTFALGGFFGLRFNDNVSLETGFHYARSNRVFNENGVPVDETPDTPAFRFENSRYQLDGTFVYNIGRRQPFHPFVFGGVGMRRGDEKQTDFTFEIDPETGQDILVSSEVVLNETNYEIMGHVGAGAEIYFFYNLAARAEYRLWIPKDFSQRTQQFFFAASYYF